jgi:hypothetical protein
MLIFIHGEGLPACFDNSEPSFLVDSTEAKIPAYYYLSIFYCFSDFCDCGFTNRKQ